MMNNYYRYNNNKMLLFLWRPRLFRVLHLRGPNYSTNMMMVNNNSARHDHGLSSISASNVNGQKINQHHLLLLPAFKANSQHHFCTTSNIFSDQTIISKLPDSIERKCEQWTQIVRAEWEAQNGKHDWFGRQLRCTNVIANMNISRLFLSTKDLTPEQLHSLQQQFKLGDAVELKLTRTLSQFQQQSNSIGSLDNSILGSVAKQFPDAISILIHRRLDIQEKQLIQQFSFDIKKAANSVNLENQLTFLGKRHSDWCKWPGYGTMLQAFKCQPVPEDTGLDPVDWVGSHGKDLDPSQNVALGAALNLKRPIVAVHGPPGSGKTRLLAEYLRILSQQGKKVLVLSTTNAGLYNLLATFCNKSPSAASNKGTFLCLKRFDAQLASKVIGDEFVENLIEKFSIGELQKNIEEKTKEFYEQTRALKSAIEQTQDFSKEVCSKQEAEELTEKMRDIGHRKKDESSKNLLQKTSVLFTNRSHSMLNLFIRLGLTFDVVIFDDAVLLSEFDSWSMALPTAPVLRLIGDYSQPEISVRSSIGKELNFNKSLLQRLDEQFGPEVNFHLRRQYRSNAAIQAWPNRAFYGQRAAEPDESVRDIRLDDLLEKGKSPLPGFIMDPLVLVDLGQLEGEWRDWIFKAEKGGKSWFNWGEAFLTASQIWHLFEHIPQLHPSKIAYLTLYDAQRITLRNIFSALSGRNLNNLKQIRMEHSVTNLHGQQFDVVLKNSVTVPTPKLFTDPYHLKHLNNEMCRARRQFIWFANSKWLEQGSEQSRQLLRTFHEYGRIVGPNQLMPLEGGQFQKMTMIVEENDQRMRTNETIVRKW